MVKAGFPIKANISPSSTKPIKHYYRPSSGKQLWRISDFVQRTIYSATIFLEKCRKVILEKWFYKL